LSAFALTRFGGLEPAIARCASGGGSRASTFLEPREFKDVDGRAFAAPKRLRPRRRDKPGRDDREYQPVLFRSNCRIEAITGAVTPLSQVNVQDFFQE
jgi:hypothetical protein